MFQINQNVEMFKLTSRCALFTGIIQKLLFLGFQYKVLHLLTEIKDGIESVANLLKADNTSFKLTHYDDLDEFCEFDRSLTDKTTERSAVVLHTFFTKKIRIFLSGYSSLEDSPTVIVSHQILAK